MALLNGYTHHYERWRRFWQQREPALREPQVRASTAAVFSFLAVALFAWYAVRPTARTIIYLRREIADKTALNQKMEDKISALIEAQATYEEMYDRLSLIDQALPKNPEPALVSRQLRNLANLSQASVSAIQVSSVALIPKEATPGAKLSPQKLIEELPVNLVISGQYPAIKAFVEGLLRLRRIVSIESVSLKEEAQEGVAGSLRLSVRLKAHYATQ